jgi:hypothetical protein
MCIALCIISEYLNFISQETNQNKLSLLPQKIEGQKQTMADLFQEAFNATNDIWLAPPASNSSGYGLSSYFCEYHTLKFGKKT